MPLLSDPRFSRERDSQQNGREPETLLRDGTHLPRKTPHETLTEGLKPLGNSCPRRISRDGDAAQNYATGQSGRLPEDQKKICALPFACHKDMFFGKSAKNASHYDRLDWNPLFDKLMSTKRALLFGGLSIRICLILPAASGSFAMMNM